ncbi:glycerol-3-phosphate dehydrogenase [NAD(P)+] [Marvinbryantia formatexigens DSM 14469]|uniref:Glycerol-3-phosphate dehydrogenase [NAD(P)+] n=1 Tax=Marvinbryantia formatexigens DSM 14469 TaxID=478749 RepID=C6LCM0_9FIRM|nr:NAD(P)H-dependent glycerol-3-phosphate dehydrogenase [Marvinbryantia formatexigens]EET61684.1 glycerol-3-phosphate dehydrogenase [NAD(P)+] [Marvinbryantia formatexigens DSM 14469]UWO24500.1 NAD(P)H-dependent glycerol-3-phosphate dehydrogenase [Marvinbryantia formatexigens DSM 14469]SDF10587.1 glycerol 3-phosphate dehydrogenase (NAD(P)+) [Marvinbryantia formatexigens]
MAKIGIIGAGSWGIALSVLLHNNGHEVSVWSVIPEEIAMLKEKREHETKLPGVHLSEDILFTDDLQEITADKEVLIMAVPSPYTRSTSKMLKGLLKEGQIVVNVAKGIEETTLDTLTDIIEEELPGVNAAVLSGPSHAEEVGRGIPTTCVVGAHDAQTAKYLQNIFISPVFRVYTSPDMLGIELGGALKNVIALAAGIADGLGYGDNTKAALITRGIAEISRLGTAMGGRPETFYGLTGIGDLIVTCASVHSRNRRAGYLIGQGRTMEEAMAEVKMIVEGVYSAKAALTLSQKYNIEMPIVEQVNKVLFEGKRADEAVNELMMRGPKSESGGPVW